MNEERKDEGGREGQRKNEVRKGERERWRNNK
jgi:hypothetical protein